METVDRVSNIIDSLEDTICIHILIAAAGYSKSILSFRFGRVNIFIAKAKLSKFILSMKLAGGSGRNWDRSSSKRNWGRSSSKRNWGRSSGKRERSRTKWNRY